MTKINRNHLKQCSFHRWYWKLRFKNFKSYIILHIIRMSFAYTRMSSVYHSYVLVCHLYVTRIHSYVTRMLLVFTRMSSVCQSYVLVCHLYVTRMCSYVTRIYSYVTRLWFYHEPSGNVCFHKSKVVLIIDLPRLAIVPFWHFSLGPYLFHSFC